MSDAVRERIAGLVAKLGALGATDPDRRVFGAASHDYALAPPIDPAALAAFEAFAGVPLPEAYRAWLLHAGNGGAGPAYGLAPLASFVEEGFPVPEGGSPGPDEPPAVWSSVSRPFLLTGAWAPPAPVPPLPPGTNPYDGTVLLAHLGCGYLHLLVVHGERSGEVWGDYTAADGELGPGGVGFLDWMERWLDQSIVEACLREIRAAEDGRPRRDVILAHEPMFVAAAGRSPDDPSALVDLGWFRLYQGRLDEARSWFERAETRSEGSDVRAEIGRCAASRLAGDPEDVLATIARARAREPRYVGYTRALLREEVLARLGVGDAPAALAAADALVRDMPHVDTAHLERAWVAWSAGDAAAADAVLVAAAQRQSSLARGEPGGGELYGRGTPVEERIALLREAFAARTRRSR